MNARYCFVIDNDGHWYLIPSDKRIAFSLVLSEAEEQDDYEVFNQRWSGRRLSMHITNYDFEDCQEIKL